MLVFYTTLLCQCVFSFGLYEDSGCISASFLYNWMISVVEILKILTSCEPCLTFCVLLLIWCTVVRSPRLHAVHRCVVLLQMLHVAWSVCLCVVHQHAGELCKNDWANCLWLAHVDLRNPVLYGCQDRMNPFATARGDRTLICQITLDCCCCWYYYYCFYFLNATIIMMI